MHLRDRQRTIYCQMELERELCVDLVHLVRAWTAAFTACRSCTNLQLPGCSASLIFFTGKIGVRTGDVLYVTITPASRILILHGLYKDFGVITTGLAPLISTTSNLCFAHKHDGT